MKIFVTSKCRGIYLKPRGASASH